MRRQTAAALLALLATAGSWAVAQTGGQREEFSAIAIVNNNTGSGAGRVIIQVTRWSSTDDRTLLVNTLLKDGPSDLLDALKDQ
ncbi:MAG: hypothetical protein ABI665_16195, partial [Vicinamibacterales bacterium]